MPLLVGHELMRTLTRGGMLPGKIPLLDHRSQTFRLVYGRVVHDDDRISCWVWVHGIKEATDETNEIVGCIRTLLGHKVERAIK